jgi:hypothetical protein
MLLKRIRGFSARKGSPAGMTADIEAAATLSVGNRESDGGRKSLQILA